MAPENHEQRIFELEREVAMLRDKVESLADIPPWWEKIAGSFANDPVYKKAMDLGRQYRRSQRPNGSAKTNEK